MENILDYNVDARQNKNVVYATFWTRVAATLLDVLVMLIILPVSIYNLLEWKSITVLMLTTGIGLAYKPFLEYKYGATFGKMAMKIVVTNYEFQKPNLQEIILRNIIHITSGLIDFVLASFVFSSSEFQDITTYQDYTSFIASRSNMLNIVVGLVILGDVLFMFADDQNRTLHDKIGKTLVIKRDTGQG